MIFIFLKKLSVLFFLGFLFFAGSHLAQAETIIFDGGPAAASSTGALSAPVIPANEQFSINLDKATIARGYTVGAFNNSLKLSLVPGILKEATRVDCEIVQNEISAPWNLERLSRVYQFDFRNKAAYDNAKPFYIQIAYEKESAGYKKVYFYDKNYNTWRPLPTTDYPREKIVRSLIHLPFAQIAVFADSGIMTVGKASWYAYKGGDFAASPDFPKGSKLRVFNLANNKSVDITVNDYGPDRKMHPDRAIDLDKVAFAKISSVKAGIINVKIEPLYIVPDVRGRVLGVATTTGAVLAPEIKARAAFVLNEETGETILAKEENSALPIASLTKLVALKVFFDQRPDLNSVVTYKTQDELYNYQYCSPSEAAKLRVADGETMTAEDLVYAAIVGSANNAVESLVRASGLARPDFIKKMNELAAAAGASNTRFVEPTGLSPENVSTARDYAIITKEIFNNPLIQKISTTPKYEFYTINKKTYHLMSNTNNFIRDNVFAAANNLAITGSKTGYLDEALHCLMTRATGVKGEKVSVVVLGAISKVEVLEEVKELLKYGLKQIAKNKAPAI